MIIKLNDVLMKLSQNDEISKREARKLMNLRRASDDRLGPSLVDWWWSCKCGDRHDLRANEWIKECKSVCMCWMSVVCCVCLCMLKTWKKNMMIKIMAMVIVNRDH